VMREAVAWFSSRVASVIVSTAVGAAPDRYV